MDPHHRGSQDGASRPPLPRRKAAPASAHDETAPIPRAAEPGPLPSSTPPPASSSPPPAPAAAAADSGGTARVAQLVAGEYLLTVNPIDGSEVVGCPPGRVPAVERRTAEERAERARAMRPSPDPAATGSLPPLLERTEECERLVRLLARGRSVRVTGPAGVGRSSLLDLVAERCADLAPDGVIRLSGYHRSPGDLLHDLYAAVYRAEGHRLDRPRLLEHVAGIGAVVVLDDIEFGGAALEELLDAAAECAFLVSATPDVAAPAPGSALEEVFLTGLSKDACLDLLERALRRPLTEEESDWAGGLWFESEGLPLRFVQAAALLTRREARLAAPPDPEDDAFAAGAPDPVALPSLAESAAPAELLASRLSPEARETLRLALALGGECPHSSHLPALVGDAHADAALGELVSVGLATRVAAHHRLAAGVLQQLQTGRPDLASPGRTAAQHYAWWAGHPSVTPERVAAEAEAIIAAMAAARDGGHASAAVLLARSAAPVLAAALHWGAWERTLRIGQETARMAGEVAEEAYFHHELGVLALCTGNLDRARTELEASIGMRGVLADRKGTIVGRRTLALVTDRSRGAASSGRAALSGPPAGREPASAPRTRADAEEARTEPHGIPALPYAASREPSDGIADTMITPRPTAAASGHRGRRTRFGSRRTMIAAGAGAVLAAVIGTVVTLGATSGNGTPAAPPTQDVTPTSIGDDTGGAAVPVAHQSHPAGHGRRHATAGAGAGHHSASPAPGATSGGGTPTDGTGTSGGGQGPTSAPTDPGQPSAPPSTPQPPPTRPSHSTTPTATPTQTSSGTTTPTPAPPAGSNSASGPAPNTPGSGTGTGTGTTA